MILLAALLPVLTLQARALDTGWPSEYHGSEYSESAAAQFRDALAAANLLRDQRMLVNQAKRQELRDDVPMKLGSESFSGQMTVDPRYAVTLQAVGGAPMALRDGPVTLAYGRPSLRSFFNGDRRISLTQGSQSALFVIDAANFKSFGGFQTAASGAQTYALRGSDAVAQVAQEERTARVSCSYAGYCYQCGLSQNMDGSFSNECSQRYRMNCDGHQDALQRVTVYRRVRTIELISPADGLKAAVISSAPEQFETAETLQRLGACN